MTAYIALTYTPGMTLPKLPVGQQYGQPIVQNGKITLPITQTRR